MTLLRTLNLFQCIDGAATVEPLCMCIASLGRLESLSVGGNNFQDRVRELVAPLVESPSLREVRMDSGNRLSQSDKVGVH
jgi:hypothetical protein